jgi:CO/xanthine dehydrogenase Mo-binding subunit
MHNPVGVKGAGEAGAVGSCPAVMNAIVDALWRAHRISQVGPQYRFQLMSALPPKADIA